MAGTKKMKERRRYQHTGARELSRVTVGARVERLLLAEERVNARMASGIVEEMLGQAAHEWNGALHWIRIAPSPKHGGADALTFAASFLRRAVFYLNEAAHLCANVPAREEAVEKRRPLTMTLKTAKMIVDAHTIWKRGGKCPVLKLVPAAVGGAA
jgi:hypothetical protein